MKDGVASGWPGRRGRQWAAVVVLAGLLGVSGGCEQARRGSSEALSKKPVTVSQAVLRQRATVEAGVQAQEVLLRQMTAKTNPAVLKFNSAITFYLNFGSGSVTANMSGGDGTPIKINGPVVLKPGLYGRGMVVSSAPGQAWQKIIYAAKGNLDLAKPGSLAVWLSAYHWTKPGLWNYFLTGRDAGRFFMLAPTAVYMSGAGKKGGNAIADWNPGWKTGQWHLVVLEWWSQSFAMSIDGQACAKTDEPALAAAKGPPGHLCVVRSSAGEKCVIGPLLIFNRPLTKREIQWLYRQGLRREKALREKPAGPGKVTTKN